MKNIILIGIFLIFSLMGHSQVADVAGLSVSPERSRDYDAIHYKISLSVDFDKKYLEGQNTITLASLTNGLKTIKLDAESILVTDVLSNKGVHLDFYQTEENLFIKTARSYGYNDTITFTVKYHLSEPVPGLRFIEAKGNRPEQVSSDCFPNKARQWIPCYDFPNDKATQEMIITTNSKYKVLSNGRFISKTENNNGTSTWHWRQENPNSTYLINLSIADYLVVKDSLENLPVNYWVYPSMANDVERVFGKTPYMIDFFNHLYNYEYPWAKYDQVVSGYIGGGAEATSATLLGEGIVTDGYTEQDYYREYVIAHEIAHQWWGDLITCRSWEHTWLNESFGTYSDHLYTSYDKGKDEGDYDLLTKKNNYLEEAHNRFMRPIVYLNYKQPGDNFNRHTYEKGACTLHLFRYILGDDIFFRVISAFLHKHEFQSVTTSDFIKCVKDVSGKNMDWFFDQYFYKPGHPVFTISKIWDEENKELTLTIIQEQDKWENVPIYAIPVRLGIFSEGKKEVKEYWIREKTEVIKIRLDKEPDIVRFDDGNYILKEWTYRKSQKELLFQATNDDMIGRMWAVNQLAEYEDEPKTLDLWKQIAEGDVFWAVRSAAIEMIGKYHGEDNNYFLKKCAGDNRSKTRAAAIKAMGDLKESSNKDFFKKTFKTENSYAVKAEALIAIGKCGGKSDISFLKEAGLQKSYSNVVAKASQKAIQIISENE
ncbi:M1 family aminopeptidase [Maribellus maritimus]|uniref:M1 family aminopeptidase n=1 Tax=Maribellus maritimus TaxID=2870838 RepID=UPI001EECA36E|nr:M1 family aminopeptidase [Maribellus maritimus]MCG6186321.1 HEAT repeat domain-containing protein [Maribellus maritimus]